MEVGNENVSPRMKVVKWIAPSAPWLKINGDATVCSKSQKMGLGVVVRDHRGVFLTGLSSFASFSS